VGGGGGVGGGAREGGGGGGGGGVTGNETRRGGLGVRPQTGVSISYQLQTGMMAEPMTEGKTRWTMSHCLAPSTHARRRPGL